MASSYNERVWSAEIVAEFASMRKGSAFAGLWLLSELGVGRPNGGSLFADLTFVDNDNHESRILGVELKLPNTPITDPAFVGNAESKARLLGHEYFLLWNGAHARLMRVAAPGRPEEVRDWAIPSVRSVEDLRRERIMWVSILQEISLEVERMRVSGSIASTSGIGEIPVDFIQRFVNGAATADSRVLLEACNQSATLRDDVLSWDADIGGSGSDLSVASDRLAHANLLGWVARLVFLRQLADAQPRIMPALEGLPQDPSIEAFEDTFLRVTRVADYANVFAPLLAGSHISATGLRLRIELWRLLEQSVLGDRLAASLADALEHAMDAAASKSVGHFATPPVLARLLVELALDSRASTLLDPCAGSGTIVREAKLVKVESGIPERDALSQIWASDIHHVPALLTSLALAGARELGMLVRVLRLDAFELRLDTEFEFDDPNDSSAVVRHSLPAVGGVASNLPYVRAEMSSARVPGELAIPRGDLYASLTLALRGVVAHDSRLALLTSNSWTGTEWGVDFWRRLRNVFHVTAIVRSGAGRWFANAEVMSTVLFLAPRMKGDLPSPTNFVTTHSPLDEWDAKTIQAILLACRRGYSSDSARVETRSAHEIERLAAYGILPAGLFGDLSWATAWSDATVLVHELFEIARGMRAGDNSFFYPDAGVSIEPEFVRPLLKDLRGAKHLDLRGEEIDDRAFFCDEALEDLERNGAEGAASWIRANASRQNSKGVPLSERTKLTPWYNQAPLASFKPDLVTNINFDTRFTFARVDSESVCDQRLTLLRSKDRRREMVELSHALLNSLSTALSIELAGFGRGLGALDFSKSRLSNAARVLDPRSIAPQHTARILEAFSILRRRPVEPTATEYYRADRREFELAVLSAFDLESYLDIMIDALVASVAARQSVHQ